MAQPTRRLATGERHARHSLAFSTKGVVSRGGCHYAGDEILLPALCDLFMILTFGSWVVVHIMLIRLWR